MIYLILKSYFALLFSVGIGSLSIFIIGLYFILKPKYKELPNTLKQNQHLSEDISAIAGDDMIATQLDLARAYIETGRSESARDILKSIIAEGTSQQQKEAESLLNFI